MKRFAHNQRVQVVDPSRIASTLGQPAADWLMKRLGAVRAPAHGEGAWVRLDDPLHPKLRGQVPPDHPNGRNVLLFPWECEPAKDRGYAPFHRLEFEKALTEACKRLDGVLRASSGQPESAWWRDVTRERREHSKEGLGEYVFRVGAVGRKVSLLVYSSISSSTQWSRDAGGDAIRFVHEIRSESPPAYFETGARVNRTGLQPLQRVQDRIIELLSPDVVRELLLQRR
ncbi:hypothetical protein ABIC83_003057 [Roseateles asaccharophilus]|uniref:hypothetical protein n=1 Tax=Roseateles asaccharophilus TaxID=582607 RepID=UPI00383641AC